MRFLGHMRDKQKARRTRDGPSVFQFTSIHYIANDYIVTMATDSSSIRPLSESDSLVELTELLHRAYRPLAEMGLRYLATHQDMETTKRRISGGQCSVAVRGGRIIGTVTYYPPEGKGGSLWLDRGDLASFGQLAVDPAEQGAGIGRRLIALVETQAARDRANEIALDTSIHAKHLIDWYTRLGYREVERVQWAVTNYPSVVLSKPVRASRHDNDDTADAVHR